MFNIGDKVKVKLHDKNIIRIGEITTIGKTTENAYTVVFPSGKSSFLLETELELAEDKK
ncbi:hypothetical protein [Romboutsia sp.]|uniref:hypothetical protein n=1 Tax=Romboutsia sp. TaxID=1965302 RepID=UPI002BD1BD29|nr:hypothetical protein [Romboutsia sp.]HSQ87515.1 hypothetical protein [Romboutsia sp.]